MLNFDTKGNLKPYQVIPCKVNDLKKHFVTGVASTTRQTNYDSYIKYSNDLKKALGVKDLRQWINGSFVTKKTNPKDIDLITFIDHSLIVKLGNKLDNFRPQNSWHIYEVDAYIVEVYPDNSPLNKFTHSDIIYWQDLFAHTRVNRKGEKNPKGFLEIIY